MKLLNLFGILLVCINYIWAAGGGRDETRVCIDTYKTSDTSYYNCIWHGDISTVTNNNNGKLLFKQDKTNNETCKTIGFYTCTGQPNGSNTVGAHNLKTYKDSNCTRQGNKDSSWEGCFHRSTGITPPVEPEKPEKPGDLIVEEINNIFGTGAPQNLVYTKTTGSDLRVRIFHKDNTGSFGSGLSSASCTLSGSGGTTSASANYSFWSGGGAYIFEVKGGLSKAGYYNLKCSGVDKSDNNVVSPSLTFYVAPASYNAAFKITANSKEYTINSQKADSNGETKKIALSGSSFPITKVGEKFYFTLSGDARTVSGVIDSGVNSSMTQVGEINNEIQGLNASSGARVCQAPAPTLPTNTSVRINNGIFDSNPSNNLSFSDVYKGRMSISFTDQNTKSIIDQEKSRGGCSGNGIQNGQCPYPPTFEFSFDYLVVPFNFEVKAINTNNQDIKVLYYGQGSSPLNEGKMNLQVKPLDNKNAGLKNFVSGCAAIDTELDLNGTDVSVIFIDPSNINANATSTTIKANEFTYQNNQSIANLNRVISIKKTNTPWTPNMVAEPINFRTGISPLMYFSGKKNDSSYPQYTPNFDSLKDTIILRGRINIIDADNASDYSKIPTSKVYYEFYCQTCNLNDVSKATGVAKYTGSPTSPGWWIDTTFSTFNKSVIAVNNISTTNNLKVSSVSAVSNGLQNINYNNANSGKYEVTINQGTDANNFPMFLLYKPFYNSSVAQQGTSAFVTIYNKINDNNRDFGVDSGLGKNTRSGSRTGGF